MWILEQKNIQIGTYHVLHEPQFKHLKNFTIHMCFQNNEQNINVLHHDVHLEVHQGVPDMVEGVCETYTIGFLEQN